MTVHFDFTAFGDADPCPSAPRLPQNAASEKLPVTVPGAEFGRVQALAARLGLRVLGAGEVLA